MEKEDPAFVEMHFSQTSGWYGTLLDAMRVNTIRDVHSNHVTFITFNYDRSLEFFLYETIRARTKAFAEEVAKAINNVIPIYHVHGKFGRLPWQDDDAVIIQYDGKTQSDISDTVKKAASGLTFTHESSSNQVSAPIKFAIAGAEEIICLGFGWHAAVIEKLGLGAEKVVVKVCGTGSGMQEGELRTAKSSFHSAREHPQIYDCDCADFFRKHYVIKRR